VKLPRHINLIIEHQPHVVNYQTVEEWLADNGGEECDSDDRARMIDTGEVWYVQWYPDTPVGFLRAAAATLDRALEVANAAAELDDRAATEANTRMAIGVAYGDTLSADQVSRLGVTDVYAYGNLRIGSCVRVTHPGPWFGQRGTIDGIRVDGSGPRRIAAVRVMLSGGHAVFAHDVLAVEP
jgi:hypothetical protein